jgi:hypothetical protein
MSKESLTSDEEEKEEHEDSQSDKGGKPLLNQQQYLPRNRSCQTSASFPCLAALVALASMLAHDVVSCHLVTPYVWTLQLGSPLSHSCLPLSHSFLASQGCPGLAYAPIFILPMSTFAWLLRGKRVSPSVQFSHFCLLSSVLWKPNTNIWKNERIRVKMIIAYEKISVQYSGLSFILNPCHFYICGIRIFSLLNMMVTVDQSLGDRVSLAKY